MRLAGFYKEILNKFEYAALDNPAREARLVLRHAAGIDEATLIAEPDKELSPEQINAIEKMATRRAGGEPLSRILGYRDFYGLKFFLNAETLDPRPETEHLVAAVLEEIKDHKNPLHLLDLGTGTGCIPISILKNAPHVTALAVDISKGACDQAAVNAQHHSVADRFEIRVSNWGENVQGMFDIITANPPYIPTHDIATLDSSVTTHDPSRALDGGTDGFDSFRAVLTVIKNHLDEHGAAFIEIGAGQLIEARRLVEEFGLDPHRVVIDYADIPRVIVVRRTP